MKHAAVPVRHPGADGTRMMFITFPETLLHAVTGRNGYLHLSGLDVVPHERKVMVTTVGPKGAQNAGMTLMASDCGAVARAIAEAAAQADPGAREEIAAQLRAALVTIETGANEDLDDPVSDFSGGWGPR